MALSTKPIRPLFGQGDLSQIRGTAERLTRASGSVDALGRTATTGELRLIAIGVEVSGLIDQDALGTLSVRG